MNAIGRFSLPGRTRAIVRVIDTTERHRAALAEALFIANLSILPGIALAAIFLLWLRHRHDGDLAAIHLEQALFTTLWAGAIALGTVLVTVQLGGSDVPLTWAILLPALVLIHTTLIVLGVVALTRALSGQPWRYPVLGPLMPDPVSGKD
jgi:prepilin signal peptidase PulO-like enzyme (type II secretory pathway)